MCVCVCVCVCSRDASVTPAASSCRAQRLWCTPLDEIEEGAGGSEALLGAWLARVLRDAAPLSAADVIEIYGRAGAAGHVFIAPPRPAPLRTPDA